MISSAFSLVALAAVVANSLSVNAHVTPPRDVSSLTKRDSSATILVGCFSGGLSCACPTDNNGDNGVLINFFPGFQCAYPGGACSWESKSGALDNTAQTNCPLSAPCPASGCVCPKDNNGDTGVLINSFTGFQCAFPSGACTWSSDGSLANTHQTNCPSFAKCSAFN